MKSKNISFILLFFLFLFPLSASAKNLTSSAPSTTYQYDEQGRLEAVTTESVFEDGSRMVTVTLMDPVLQLPVSEDTVISSLDGSRETINITYTRDMFGTILSQSTVTVERDGSELKDIITNNSYGSNTYRKTEAYDPFGTLMMSEETCYVYNADNVLLSSRQNSFQQNGHDITTIITYDASGKNPVEMTTDYSLADGSTGTTTEVFQPDLFAPIIASLQEGSSVNTSGLVSPVDSSSSTDAESPEPPADEADISSDQPADFASSPATEEGENPVVGLEPTTAEESSQPPDSPPDDAE